MDMLDTKERHGLRKENNMFNTIILLKGEARLSRREYKNFSEGDTIWGADSSAEEIKRWDIEHEEEAKEELKKYKCSTYTNGSIYTIEEYALEYCECNDDGEFVIGSDYDLAEKE